MSLGHASILANLLKNGGNKIIKKLKDNKFPGNIIIGGPQISYLKSNHEKYYQQADIFIRGYAENCLLEYLQSKEKYPKVAGQADDNRVARAGLESLPSPILSGLIPPQHFIRWETQKGCPFRCSFCQHRETDLGGEALRRRNFEQLRVFNEIQWLAENKIGDLAVVDPTFNSGKQHVGIISEALNFMRTKRNLDWWKASKLRKSRQYANKTEFPM
ncbi:unnamed protein product, partial [Mesorhabditis belari]|uniref:Radical SAM core domain-containing protein n=1 Tax=Mesorhabditis belari TaxID=2138241 RepID=A0AAF3JB35_9BILA